MKIGYFVCSKYYGGVEKIIIDTLNEICKYEKVFLIVPKGCEFLDRLDGDVEIYEYKSYDKRYNVFLYLEIYKFLKLNEIEILHSHGVKATQIGFVLEKLLNIKIIATKHNNRKGKIFNKVKNVIAVSKEVAKSIDGKSEVIYFGVKKQEILGKKNDIFTIVAIGRLDKIKGFDSLIKEVSKLDFDYELRIYGEGREKENLKNLIGALNLEKKVKLCGFSKEIPQILASSHLQVISSFKEGLPIILLEGIFYSPIVISTPVGGIVEILDCNFLAKQSELGYLIDKVYKNYEFWVMEFENKHSKFKDKLTFSNYISNLQKFYKELL